MQTLLNAAQMRIADAYTIKNQPISSINLMEKAAKAFVKVFKKEVSDKESRISILCGQGNNGGDGLAIARLLASENYKNIAVYLIDFSTNQSEDNKKNIKRLLKLKVPVTIIKEAEKVKDLQADVLIDAILGSGLNKPLQGDYATIASFINDLKTKVVSVDVPTGFNSEGGIAEKYNGIKADLTICFQRPKINFFFPESVKALTKFKVVDIGLDEDFIENQKSEWKLTTESEIKQLLKPKKNFSHKDTYGHALLVAGNNATMGAALLSASSCLHTGAGLTTVCLPQSGLIALNTSLPEVMALPRNQYLATEAFDRFSAIAVGPGLGVEEENEELLEKLVYLRKPLVLDADALTLLSQRGDLLHELPAGSILTPHMKEFDRLFGEHKNWWKRVETARREAMERNLIFVLKNQYTFVCLPDGNVHINSTGNPAMASGGMGDVLTGIIISLLAQSYSSADAAILGTYLHGKAGDELAKKRFTVSASQLALQIPKTMKRILK
ncbi:NAD(P)H-hydrate dehydratase [Pedobacter sp. UC225_61]|uniref:NAD(P)H-hydrate dehydratase n=1 Tax=Pedobacter sp. UC225_61 TaxID=3374623 RepID=UPI0037A366DF